MSKLVRRLSTICVRIFLTGFFIASLLTACRQDDRQVSISIIWHRNKATGLSIPRSLLKEDVFKESLKVQLVKSGERTSILGEFKIEDDYVLFEPLVPLTRGLRYEIVFKNVSLAEINIPTSDSPAPELLAIYPTQDTVPENLLKIYLQFSQPMAEGRSLSYVTLLRDDRDTMKGTFLALQPELWNSEGTVLTLWLDPGRIKRDLIPNKELGAPLMAGEMYTLIVSNKWMNKEGIAMMTPFRKTFRTMLRDDQSPAVAAWLVKPPTPGTKQSLEIDFIEPLDYSLLYDAIKLLDAEGVLVAGEVQVGNEERTYRFTPQKEWKAGDYSLQIESRLEDNAGNNLSRPFDRDITTKGPPISDQKFFERRFAIR